MKVVFLGTPNFVQPIKDSLSKHFSLAKTLDKADLAVVASFGRILTKNELNTPKFGCINVHPSLLPKYRGPSPIQAAILNGEQVSGVSIIKMDEQIDHGPIIYQERLELSNDDNFHTLSKKMFLRSAQVLPEVIKDFISGKIKPTPQDDNQASFCPLLTRKDGYFDINNLPDPQTLDRMIRAYYPWPSAWTKWSFGSAQDKNDKIVKFLPNKMLQMEGKRPIPFKDFLNGYPDFPIKQLLVSHE